MRRDTAFIGGFLLDRPLARLTAAGSPGRCAAV